MFSYTGTSTKTSQVTIGTVSMTYTEGQGRISIDNEGVQIDLPDTNGQTVTSEFNIPNNTGLKTKYVAFKAYSNVSNFTMYELSLLK